MKNLAVGTGIAMLAVAGVVVLQHQGSSGPSMRGQMLPQSSSAPGGYCCQQATYMCIKMEPGFQCTGGTVHANEGTCSMNCVKPIPLSSAPMETWSPDCATKSCKKGVAGTSVYATSTDCINNLTRDCPAPVAPPAKTCSPKGPVTVQTPQSAWYFQPITIQPEYDTYAEAEAVAKANVTAQITASCGQNQQAIAAVSCGIGCTGDGPRSVTLLGANIQCQAQTYNGQNGAYCSGSAQCQVSQACKPF